MPAVAVPSTVVNPTDTAVVGASDKVTVKTADVAAASDTVTLSIDTVGVLGWAVMLTVPSAVWIVPPAGLDRRTVKVSRTSAMVSDVIGISICAVVWLAANTIVPCPDWKSLPAVADPLTVA